MRILFLLLIILACSCTKDPAPPAATPYVQTSIYINSLTRTSVICNGTVISGYGAPVTARGFCWSTSSNPSIANSNASNGYGLGAYAVHLTGLQPSRTYFARAYAINKQGISYGQIIYFTTPN